MIWFALLNISMIKHFKYCERPEDNSTADVPHSLTYSRGGWGGGLDYMFTAEDPWAHTEDLVWTKLEIKEIPDVGLITQHSELYFTLKRANKEEIMALLGAIKQHR